MAGDGGFADPLAGAGDRQRRERERREDGRVEAKVRTGVGQAAGEDPAGDPEALARPEHRLVREVDHQPRLVLGDPLLQPGGDGHAVVLTADELLGAAGDPDRDHLVRQRLKRIAHDRRVVLPVDHNERPHDRVVTSSSIRAVYFSNASVSVENWMIRSSPWNGYLRHTSTCRSAISITL